MYNHQLKNDLKSKRIDIDTLRFNILVSLHLFGSNLPNLYI